MDDQQNPQNQPTPTEPPTPDQPVGAPTPANDPAEEFGTIPTQQMFQPSVPQGPVTPPNVPPAPVVPSNKKSTKTPIIVLAVLFALIVGGAAWYFLMGPGKAEDTPPSQPSTSTQTEETELAAETIDSTFTSGLAIKSTVTVTHPSSWTVKNDHLDDEAGSNLNFMSVGSPSNHYLQVYDVDGIGGNCDNDTDTYKLVKKIPTKTKDVYFTEYEVDGVSRGLMIEDLSKTYPEITGNEAHVKLTEGQTNTNTCNIPGWSIHGAYMAIYSTGDWKQSGEATKLGYADIKDDTEFVTMLESVTVVIPEE